MVEGARLESVYTVTPYRGFESLLLRHRPPTLVSVIRAVLQAAEVWAQFRANPSILRKSSRVSGDIRAELCGRYLAGS